MIESPPMSPRRPIPVRQDPSQRAPDCPHAPPPRASVYARTLNRACLIVGGIDVLAGRLQIPLADLRRWMTGAEQPPASVFEQCVEILLLYTSGGLPQ
ncbi:MAG TPA: hypothetical protein VD965_14135 [Burkholderiales bacterium]|nr:hypothetical protein [Burkholderiales bacterium]